MFGLAFVGIAIIVVCTPDARSARFRLGFDVDVVDEVEVVVIAASLVVSNSSSNGFAAAAARNAACCSGVRISAAAPPNLPSLSLVPKANKWPTVLNGSFGVNASCTANEDCQVCLCVGDLDPLPLPLPAPFHSLTLYLDRMGSLIGLARSNNPTSYVPFSSNCSIRQKHFVTC